MSNGEPELKVVFLGESSVGKTSIITCFSPDGFTPNQTPTVGACFSVKNVDVDGEIVKLKVWDTAGQERFRALTPMYYRDAQVAILVFALDSYDSFDKLKGWVDDLERDTRIRPEIIIVGNKSDLKRKVEQSEAEGFAGSVGATYWECSAKTKDGVEDMFCQAAQLGLKSDARGMSGIVEDIVRGDDEQTTKKKCC